MSEYNIYVTISITHQQITVVQQYIINYPSYKIIHRDRFNSIRYSFKNGHVFTYCYGKHRIHLQFSPDFTRVAYVNTKRNILINESTICDEELINPYKFDN